MTGNPPYRRRFLVGLALAALTAAGTIHAALTAARAAERESLARRAAVVQLQALAQSLNRVGPSGASIRAMVAGWEKFGPAVPVIRVVLFEGISLEASTAPGDEGAKAAPRRLSHEEKSIYDQGQRLRASVEINRQEGAPRKAEIEIEPIPGDRLALAAPMERDGAVVGVVSIEAIPADRLPKGVPLLPAALAVILPVVLFWLASRWMDEKGAALAVLAALLLLGSIAALGWRATGTLAQDRKLAEGTVATVAAREVARAEAAVRATATAEELSGRVSVPIEATNLDVDAFRRPLGRMEAGRAEQDLADLTSAARRLLAVLGLFALGLLALIGTGAAARFARTIRKNRQAYFYVLPAMVGMLVLVFFPFVYGVILSFTDSTLFNTDKSIPEIWIGLRNYGEILGNFAIVKQTPAGPIVDYLNFYWTLFNTVLWTITNVSIGVSVGLFLALILNTRGLALRPVYRVLLILPWAMPNYITSLIWRGMFHQQFGVINQVIQIFGGQPVSWFNTWPTSFATALATNGWLSFPFMMVVSLGALQSIPNELYEASRIDGATRWQRFQSITLPSLKPALVPAVILSVIWTFNMFNIIYLVTQGEPGSSTEILITQSYKYAFERYRYGYAAAYSTVIFAILLLYGWWQNRASRATESIA
jgi:arabinogalactan oligomer/maltooligosaccharide transport system permease protein